MTAKLPVMADKATPGTEKATFMRLLMAMVETPSTTAVEIATAMFPSTVKATTRGGGSHLVAVVGASIGEITSDAMR